MLADDAEDDSAGTGRLDHLARGRELIAMGFCTCTDFRLAAHARTTSSRNEGNVQTSTKSTSGCAADVFPALEKFGAVRFRKSPSLVL